MTDDLPELDFDAAGAFDSHLELHTQTSEFVATSAAAITRNTETLHGHGEALRALTDAVDLLADGFGEMAERVLVLEEERDARLRMDRRLIVFQAFSVVALAAMLVAVLLMIVIG